MVSKEFQQIYDCLSYTRDRSEVFTDFMDVCLYYLSIGILSEEYNQIKKKYNDKELSNFHRMLEIVADHSEDFVDALGDLFMEYVSHGHNGQFFTPTPISDLMARITGVKELQPNQSACDPCCGSGRMLLSAAKQCAEKNENARPYCYGSDIDLLCVKMCVVNMIINSIPGEIAWMNTITMEHWRSYHIKLTLICGMWFPSLQITGAGETSFIIRLEKTIEENPEMIEQINKNVKPKQLILDF